jgi:arylsulfatase A-like enzyme
MPSRSTRREFIKQAGAVAAAGAMPALAQRGAGTQRRPNILFLFPDQHRPDWVQGTPGIPIPTPNLSRLASRAIRFDRTLAASPVCAPSRACLASGREYDRCGVINNGDDYPRQQYTFYRALRDSGYHTMTCGKIDLSTSETALGISGRQHLDAWGFSDGIYSPGKGRGFRAYLQAPPGAKDSYYAYLEQHDPALARRVAEDYARRFGLTLEQAAASRADQQTETDAGRKDQQWLDTDASPAPDDHYVDNWIARNGLELIDRAPKDRPWLLYVNYAGPHPPMDITASMERRFRGPDRVIDGFPQPHDYRGDIKPEHHLRIRQNYAAMIENIDRWTGVYLDTLERRGELDNTLIVYASDHGEMLGDHGRWGKSVPFHPSANVPLYVAGPGVRQGRRSDALVSLMDLAATFLDYGGVEAPEDMDSRSLRPVLEGRTEQHREYVLSGLKGWRLAWDGRYKYVTGFGKGEDLVFDLAEDAAEDRNLAAAAPKAALRMRDVLAGERAKA